MPTILKKENLPAVAYLPIMIDGELVMFNPTVRPANQNTEGFAAYYPHLDEVRYITFKEIAEHLMTATCEHEKDEEKPTGKPRPVRKTPE